MPLIYTEIQLFDMDQSIYRIDERGELHLIAKAPLESLGDVIAEQCYDKDIYTVRLHSNLIELGFKVKQQIETNELTKYNTNKIIVELR